MAMSPAPPPMPWVALDWIVSVWMLLITDVSAAFIYVTCCRKKKPVQDLMAKPTFNKPVTVASKPKTLSKQPIEKKPIVEHTVSIKLENDADEDDLKGPRESTSRDPMTDVPVPMSKNKAINEFKSEHDKDIITSPSSKKRDNTSKSKEEVKRVKEMQLSVRKKLKDKESLKKKDKTIDEISVLKKFKVKSKPKGSTNQIIDKQPKKTTTTVATYDDILDATQEIASSDPEGLQSAKEGSIMSYISSRKRLSSPKRKPTSIKDMDPTQEDPGTTLIKGASTE